jgi:hypothetical protein
MVTFASLVTSSLHLAKPGPLSCSATSPSSKTFQYVVTRTRAPGLRNDCKSSRSCARPPPMAATTGSTHEAGQVCVDQAGTNGLRSFAPIVTTTSSADATRWRTIRSASWADKVAVVRPATPRFAGLTVTWSRAASSAAYRAMKGVQAHPVPAVTESPSPTAQSGSACAADAEVGADVGLGG